MPTRAQVLELLDLGHSYETAARTLGVPPGLAFMVATGLPADGGEAAGGDSCATMAIAERPQQLVNPRQFSPGPKPHVIDWVRERAKRELAEGG